jgi:ribose transport system substrate-binding protein
MEHIQAGDSVIEATVIYPSTQAADGIKLARLIAQSKNMSDLVSAGVPRVTQLYAPVVTADNVEQYLPIGFRS